jgi:hypothetical protein
VEEPAKRQGGAKPAKRPKKNAALKVKSSAGAGRADNLECRALIVGINDYQGTVNDLPSCVNDARAVDDLVRGAYRFGSTKLLLDADATLANVTSELERLFSKATSGTRLLFYYSGHGSTDRKGDKLEECLVLSDGFFFDDKLVKLASAAPPGILTSVLDSCFSGGMDKQLLKTAFRTDGAVERARVKAYLRVDPEEFAAHSFDQQELQSGKRFLGTTFFPPISIVNDVLLSDAPEKALIPAPASDEAGQKTLNGLLLSACLETETAAASTASTDGKSAFTFGLLEALKALGYRASSSQLAEAIQQKLKRLGFRQTPLIKEPLAPIGMGKRSFLTLEEAKAGAPAVAAESPGDLTTALANALLQNNSGGGPTMDAEIIIRVIEALTKSSQPAPKSKGLGDLLPVILPLILKAGPAPQPANKGIVDILPIVLPLLTKSSAPAQEKLFGIDDAILIPVLTTVINNAMNKGPAASEKLFGIDDAILVPVLTTVINNAMNR